MGEISRVATAIKAIEGWQRNRMTTFTPSNILSDFGEDILSALRLAAKDEAGPVAWRTPMVSKDHYQLTSYADVAAQWLSSGASVEPLYAATPPTAAKDEARELSHNLATGERENEETDSTYFKPDEARERVIDQAWNEINALGGSQYQDNSYDQGIVDTVRKALEIVEKLGGMGPKQREAQP